MNATRNTPRNTNCAQKSTTPKKGKLTVTLLRNVETTVGVQTFFAAELSADSVQGMMWDLWLEQSGCSPGCLGGWSQ